MIGSVSSVKKISANEIEDRSFCILNNRGYGDVMPSVALADHLKRRGAKHISLGIDCARDIDAFRYFSAIDHIFQFYGKNHNPLYFDFSYDHVINQNWFTFEGGHSFYSYRFDCVNGAEIIRPQFLLPDNLHDRALHDLLPSLGLDPFRYIAFHPQANYKTRTLSKESMIQAIELNTFPVVVIGDDVDCQKGINFSNDRSMEETLILLYYSRAFMGVCSCWSHFAWAMNKESFIFFSVTNHANMWSDYHGSLGFIQCRNFENGINVDDWGAFDGWLKFRGL